jgi:hypothetical protein
MWTKAPAPLVASEISAASACALDRERRVRQYKAMSFRIVDAPAGLEQAIDRLRQALTEWAGGKAETWGEGGQDGASFSRRDDVYLFVAREEASVSIGAALTARDQETLKIELPRRAPARDRKRTALVLDENDAPFLMISIEELRAQGIRDPLKRLTGAAMVKHAAVSGRDYLLIGPLHQPKVADALLALAALSPKFEAHLEKLGAFSEESEEDLYLVSPQVAAAHRVHAKVASALMARLRAAGFQAADLRNGPIRADLCAARADATIAFEIRPDASVAAFLQALGALALIAPGGGSFRRALVLPAAREQLGAALAPFEASFREAGVWVLMYEFKDGAPILWSQVAPTDLPGELRTLFS